MIPYIVGVQPKDFDAANENHRLIRLYIGLEDPDYLIADLKQALE